jgi:hypothetical protein
MCPLSQPAPPRHPSLPDRPSVTVLGWIASSGPGRCALGRLQRCLWRTPCCRPDSPPDSERTVLCRAPIRIALSATESRRARFRRLPAPGPRGRTPSIDLAAGCADAPRSAEQFIYDWATDRSGWSGWTAAVAVAAGCALEAMQVGSWTGSATNGFMRRMLHAEPGREDRYMESKAVDLNESRLSRAVAGDISPTELSE